MWTYDPNTPDSEFVSGWAPSPPDPRDHIYVPPAAALAPSKTAVNIPTGHWPAWAQGSLPSCTAQAIAGAMGLLLRNHRRVDASHTHEWEPSRMFIYYNERAEIGAQSRAVPAHVRSAVKAVQKTGICPEALWPYDLNKWSEKPSAEAYEAALPHKEIRYRRIDRDLSHLKACINEGHPFTIGFRLFLSLLSPDVQRTGDIPAPDASQLAALPHRGHCVLATGYDDSKERFTIRNSYGPTWGNEGTGTLPYMFVTTPKLCADLWTVRWQDEEPIQFDG